MMCNFASRLRSLSLGSRDRTRLVAYFMRHQLAPISSADDPVYTVNPLKIRALSSFRYDQVVNFYGYNRAGVIENVDKSSHDFALLLEIVSFGMEWQIDPIIQEIAHYNNFI